MRVETIITGCALYDPAKQAAVWGDLWESGDSWIFNACLAGGEATWDYKPKVHSQLRYVEIIDPFCVYFERRGVIVVPKAACALSQAAQTYLCGGA